MVTGNFKTFLFSLIFLSILFESYSQNNSNQIDSLLKIIKNSQFDKEDVFYNKGMFESIRYNALRKKVYQDNNIFFPAIIAYLLKEQYGNLSSENKIIADSIISGVKSNFFRYKNRNGDITYNFWQTQPNNSWPNNKRLSKNKNLLLPDDFDDTSIIYLVEDFSEEQKKELKQKFIPHTNLYSKKVKSNLTKYNHISAYNTWFGEKMKLEIDVCVLANTMLFIFENKYELNQYDKETIWLIKSIITENDHIKNPYIISTSYQRTSTILYHIARLISKDDNNTLYGIRKKVIIDLKICLEETENEIEKAMILSSLYRLGENIEHKIEINNNDYENFNFFSANYLSISNVFYRKLFGKMAIFNSRHLCKSHNYALMLEYLLLKEKYLKQIH